MEALVSKPTKIPLWNSTTANVDASRATRSRVSRRYVSKPKWHLVYYLLAAFDLFTVSTSLYLNHRLMDSYTQSVAVNQHWAKRLQNYSELGQLAAAVNAPGNNIFDSGNVKLEQKNLGAALLPFQQQMATVRLELRTHAEPVQSKEILEHLDQVNVAMSEMTDEARLIFADFQQKRPDRAGQRMATMDRKYAEVNTALANLRQKVSQIQQQILEQQKHQTLQLKQYEYAIAGSIMFMVVGVTIYGHKLAQQLSSDAQAKEELIQELQATEANLKRLLAELHRTQAHLVQTEKMSALGQMVAGVAHEINNPVNFIHGNLSYIEEYAQTLMDVVQTYQQHYPHPPKPLQRELDSIDLEFLTQDLSKILRSVKGGTRRIQEIVLSLRNFSRLDEAEWKAVDIHEGIDSSLMILQHRLKAKVERPEIQVVKNYASLPEVACYAGQLNQVFLNLLANAVDALEELNEKRSFQEIAKNPNIIWIQTQLINHHHIRISIRDNGIGLSEQSHAQLFNPFFTTKPIGKGTGLGLPISYQVVVDKHGGKLYCNSTQAQGTEFVIEIPVKPTAAIT